MKTKETLAEDFAHDACDQLMIRQGAVWGGTFEFCKRAFLAGFEKCKEEALECVWDDFDGGRLSRKLVEQLGEEEV